MDRVFQQKSKIDLITWGILVVNSVLFFRLPFNVSIIEVWFLIILFVHLGVKKSELYCNKHIFFGFLGFCLLTTLSVPLSYDIWGALKTSIRWLSMFCVYLGVVIYFKNKSLDQKLNFLFGVSVALILFSQINDGVSILETGRLRTGAALLIPFCILLFRYDINHNITTFFTLTLLTSMIYFSQSRTVWVGFLAILLIRLLSKKGLSLWLSISTILIVIFLSLNSDLIQQRITQLNFLAPDAAYSTFQRIYRVLAALNAFYDHPLLGVGGNSIYEYLLTVNIGYLEDWKIWLHHNERTSVVTHNVILQNFAEHGLFAGLIFCFIIYQCFKVSIRSDNHILQLQLFLVILLFLLTGYISELYRIFFVTYLAYISTLPAKKKVPLI